MRRPYSQFKTWEKRKSNILINSPGRESWHRLSWITMESRLSEDLDPGQWLIFIEFRTQLIKGLMNLGRLEDKIIKAHYLTILSLKNTPLLLKESLSNHSRSCLPYSLYTLRLWTHPPSAWVSYYDPVCPSPSWKWKTTNVNFNKVSAIHYHPERRKTPIKTSTTSTLWSSLSRTLSTETHAVSWLMSWSALTFILNL